MFKSLPLTHRQVRATEARLQAIYDAAALGLRGDALALAAGMLPSEYRQLCQLDPLAEMAAQKGAADAQAEMAACLREAARNGDSKAALAILQNRHDWVAKQQVQMSVEGQISILGALEQARNRVVEGAIIDEARQRANADRLLTNQPVQEVDNGSTDYITGTPEGAAELRP